MILTWDMLHEDVSALEEYWVSMWLNRVTRGFMWLTWARRDTVVTSLSTARSISSQADEGTSLPSFLPFRYWWSSISRMLVAVLIHLQRLVVQTRISVNWYNCDRFQVTKQEDDFPLSRVEPCARLNNGMFFSHWRYSANCRTNRVNEAASGTQKRGYRVISI